jgi:hypothetical protein
MRSRAWWCAVLAIFALRFLLSLRGIDYGLPEAHEPDSELVRQSLYFRGDAPAKPEQLAMYPHLVSRLMALVPRPSAIGEIEPGKELEAHLRFAARHFHAARCMVAFLSACAVPLCWLLARRFLEPPWALLATTLLATSLLHFDYSQQARPHGPLATFVLASILASTALARRPSGWSYLLAAVTAALAIGALHNGIIVVLAGLAAHLFAARGRGARAQLWLLLPLGAIALSLALFYPFLFDGTGLALRSTQEEGPSDFPHHLSAVDGSGFAKLWNFFWDYDPLLWALALAAASVWVVRAIRARRLGAQESRTDLLVPAATFLPYVLVLGVYSNVFVRFLEPLVPFAAVMAAWGVRELVRGTRVLARTPLARYALITLLIIATAYPIVRLANLRARPDTYTLCADWIRENLAIEHDRILVTPTVSLPLFQPVVRTEDYDPWKSPASHFWYRYLWDVPVESLSYPLWRIFPVTPNGVLYTGLGEYPSTEAKAARILENMHGDYAVVTSGGKLFDSVRDAARATGERVACISPWGDDDIDRPMGLDYRGRLFWWKLLNVRNYGPLLEVYRLR